MWAMYWSLGWGLQGLACLIRKNSEALEEESFSQGFFEESIDAKWYWRLILGLPPTRGKVAIRPAVLQILAIFMFIVELTLYLTIGSGQFKKLFVVLSVIYWALAILTSVIISRRSSFERK
jgi:hypothetical protein